MEIFKSFLTENMFSKIPEKTSQEWTKEDNVAFCKRNETMNLCDFEEKYNSVKTICNNKEEYYEFVKSNKDLCKLKHNDPTYSLLKIKNNKKNIEFCTGTTTKPQLQVINCIMRKENNRGKLKKIFSDYDPSDINITLLEYVKTDNIKDINKRKKSYGYKFGNKNKNWNNKYKKKSPTTPAVKSISIKNKENVGKDIDEIVKKHEKKKDKNKDIDYELFLSLIKKNNNKKVNDNNIKDVQPVKNKYNKKKLTKEKKKDLLKLHILNNDKTNINYVYHISDIHVERTDTRREEYIQVVDRLCNKMTKKDSLIVITGDIVDFKNNITTEGLITLIEILVRLSNTRPLIIIPGNHDANVSSSDSEDILLSIYNKINTINPIYYLRNSGIYKYNNIIFSVSSVFDRYIINPNDIKRDNNEKLILLHHGFVYCKKEKMNFMLNFEYFKIDDVKGYDFVMLGDIHKHHFLDKNIAYSGSLLQRNYGETVENHGYILWNLKKGKGKFKDIKNDYGYVTVYLDEKNIQKSSNTIPTNVRLKLRYTETTNQSTIDKFIKMIKKKHNIIELIKEVIPGEKDIEILNIKKIDMSNKDIINKIIKNYLNNEGSVGKTYIKKIQELHKIYYDKVKDKITDTKNIKLIRLYFDNINSYGEGNEIKFTKSNYIHGLIGENATGKSTIIDAITYALFDRSLRTQSNVKSDILNIHKSHGKIELELLINGKRFIILKTLKRKSNVITRKLMLYEHDGHKFNKKNNWTMNENKSEIAKYLGITLDDFKFSNICPQYEPKEFLDRGNHERQQIIAKYLKMDYFELINKKVNDDICDVYNSYQYDKKKITEYEEELKKLNINKIKKYENIKIKLNKKIKDVTIEKSGAEKKIINVGGCEKLSEVTKQLKSLTIKHKQIKSELNVLIKKYDKRINKIYKKRYNDSDIDDLENISYHKLIDLLPNKEELKNTLHLKSAKYDNLNEKLDEILDHNILKIQKKVNRLGTINKEITEKKININKIEKELSILEKNRIIIKENNKLNRKILRLDKILNDLNEKNETNNEQIMECKEIVINAKIIKNEINKLKKNVIDNEKKMVILKKYETMTSFCGLQTQIFENVRLLLENNINDILKKFSNLKIKLVIERKNKKTNINMYKIDNGKELNASNCSGFERIAINLSVKIALSGISKLPLPCFLIIDESLSCVDKNNINKIDRLFDYIRKTFNYSLFISHDDRIQNKYDKIIEIKKINGFSKIVN